MALTLATPLKGDVDVTLSQMVAAVQINHLTKYSREVVNSIAHHTREMSATFGFRTSLLWAQILHETGRFRYGGQVQPHQWNFAGLGATNDGAQGATFDSILEGVLAVCAHRALYQYGDIPQWPEHLQKYGNRAIRRDAVKSAGYLGVATTVGDFTNGRWAWSPQYPIGSLQNGYASALVRIANEILDYPSGEEPMTAQIPGFKWEPAAPTHYEKGRRDRVRGGAQHYTAGTNSLNWLTKSSNPPVSAHFLIKNKPTLEDRGWQLVRIEDTAWTTSFANPYTVSIEFEHTGTGSISAEAYKVMAQTWIDIAKYVKDKGLGEISLTREGIKPHKEWVNNPALICSDGVNVDRIVAEIRNLEGNQPAPTDPNDPNAQAWDGVYIINAEYPGVGRVNMLDFYREMGGEARLGRPLSGMVMVVEGGKRIFKQRTENVLMEYWPDGFGNLGQYYRFGRTVQ